MAMQRISCLRKKLGIEATADNRNNLKLQKKHEEKVAAENLEAAQEFGKELAEQKVVVKMKAGENGKAFGSVSSKEIAKAYADQYKKDLDKKKLVLPDAIKNFGTYEVKVKAASAGNGSFTCTGSGGLTVGGATCGRRSDSEKSITT